MGRSLGKHYAYHNEDGHLTQGCRDLKAHLEDLVRQGHLRDLVDEAKTKEKQIRLPQAPAAPPPPPSPQQANGPRVINAIHSRVNETEVRGKTQRVRHLQHVYQVQQKKSRTNEYQGPMVSFTEANLDMVQHPHNDALVIILKIENYQVRRILVNQGSSCDIMYVRYYKELDLHSDDLKQSSTPIVGFSRTPMWPLGATNLEVQADTKKTVVTRNEGCSLNTKPAVAVPNGA
ncbi:uncharacterized protein LOC114268276 [Camellia sinensis]|uniref:uncharacterized protein LOC114268276 n=1 Tax=Camellia sinensis TaxID=4442 RepID=UPI0010362EC6|nr:uncharacterized protein LOC114268276 [Camellia sinensis]